MYHDLKECLSVAKTDDGKFVINFKEEKKKEKEKDNKDTALKDVPCVTMEETKTVVAVTIDEVSYKIKEYLKGKRTKDDKKKEVESELEEL